MASPTPPAGPRKGQENVKTPSEQMLQNILDRLPTPTTPLERIYELKEELAGIDKQCNYYFYSFLFNEMKTFNLYFSTNNIRCNSCCSKTTSCIKCCKSIFTCCI